MQCDKNKRISYHIGYNKCISQIISAFHYNKHTTLKYKISTWWVLGGYLYNVLYCRPLKSIF